MHVYYHAVAALPALVRQWFDEQRSRQLVLKVEDFTAKFVSPRLVQLELATARVRRVTWPGLFFG